MHPGGWPLRRICLGGASSLARVFCLIRGQTICDLACYFIFYFIPLIFHLPFSLKRISLCTHHISWHQLDCVSKYNIISSLSVPFVVGLALGFGVSSLEAFLHLLHTGRDSPEAHIRTYCREKKVNQRFRSLPKHEVMGQTSRNL